MFVASVAIAAIATTVAVAMGVDPKALADPTTSPVFTSATWVALGTVPVQLALIASLAVAIRVTKPRVADVLPIGRPSPAALLGGVLVVFGLWPFAGAAAEAVHRLLGTDITASRIISLAARDADPLELGLLYFTLAVIPAVGEEAMFRGFITLPFLRGSRVVGTLVPAVMFGVFHLEPIQAAGTIILGIGFGLARVFSGSLLPGALAHCVYNAAVITLARVGLDDDGMASPWLFAAGAACFAIGMLLLVASGRGRAARE